MGALDTVSELQTIIQTLSNLERMNQLNLELLEQLGVFADWIVTNNLDVPNKEHFQSLLHKTQALLNELYALEPTKPLMYRKLADEKKHLFRTDEEVPEPILALNKGGLLFASTSSYRL